MKLANWNRFLRIVAGAVCALFGGWLAIAFGIWLTILAVDHFDPAPSLFPPMELIVGFGVLWMAALPVIGFAMGLGCAFCWQNLASIKEQQHWALGLVIFFFVPSAILGLGALCVLAIGFPSLLWALNRGIENRINYRHFFGLTNDWERDEGEL